MAITQIDKNTALIAIDLQESILAKVSVDAGREVIRNTNLLLNTFHLLNLPVVLVNVSSQPSGRIDFSLPSSSVKGVELVKTLAGEPQDIRITKQAWGAFSKAELHKGLQALGVTQVVITGIATSMGVLSTAIQAYELGYNVTICQDAVTDPSSDNHHWVLNSILPKVSEIGETQEVINLLQGMNP